MRRLPFLLAALLAVTAGRFSAVADDSAPLEAPYQVRGKIQLAPSVYVGEDELYADAPLLMIDFGAADKTAPPKTQDIPPQMTVVGSKGTVLTDFVALEKGCEYLCGSEASATCHYTAQYALPPAAADIGTPLAAFPAVLDIGNVRYLRDERQVVDAVYLLPESAWGDDHPLLQPAGTTESIRIDAVDNTRQEIKISLLPSAQALQGESCQALRYPDGLGTIQCTGYALLLADGVPLLYSEPDYNEADVRLLSSFTEGATTYYLVRIGLKADSPVGLLYKIPSGWVFRLRGRDYAGLC